MNSKIETTGEFRQYLLDALIGVRERTVTTAEAQEISRLGKVIVDSMHSEVRNATLIKDLGQAVPEVGKMLIGSQGDD
jgi:hypothetical protein